MTSEPVIFSSEESNRENLSYEDYNDSVKKVNEEFYDGLSKLKVAQNSKLVEGVKVPHTVFDHELVDMPQKTLGKNPKESEIVFAPKALLEKIEQEGFSRDNENVSYNDETMEQSGILPEDIRNRLLGEEDEKSSFSGYCTVPRASLNLKHEERHPKVKLDIPKFLHQNYYYNGNKSYAWGGLQVNSSSDLSDFGIPNGIHPSQVCVYLPDELPPHVSREFLSNPLMTQNSLCTMFDEMKNTITILDAKDCPTHLNGMVTRGITDRHSFCFGGFQIMNEKVRYDSQRDRWLITRRLVLNEDAYIFDTLTLQFTIITLKKKDPSINFARMGCSIAGSRIQSERGSDLQERVPSPPIFTDNKNEGISHESSATHFNSSREDIFRSHEVPTNNASSLDRLSVNSPSSSLVSPNPTSRASTTPLSESLNKSFSTRSQSVSDTLKPFGTSKVGQVISKSTKFFHRHQRSTSGHVSKGQQDFDLKNTYSNQVKQHRSNSGNYTSSRPGAPMSISPQLTGSKGSTIDTIDFEKIAESPTSSPVLSRTSSNNKSISDVNLEDLSRESSRNENSGSFDLFEDTNATVIIFVFGGFVSEFDSSGYGKMVATSDLLRIDLTCRDEKFLVQFNDEALVSRIQYNSLKHEEWPSPRGYAASVLIDHRNSMVERCVRNLNMEQDSLGSISPVSNLSTHSFFNMDINLPFDDVPDSFFSGKALLIQGGVNEQYETFSDFYLLIFDTGRWSKISTYAFDYFNIHSQPYMDDDVSIYKKDKEIKEPKLIEAELRACHHTAMYYNSGEKNYVVFFGGFGNDYLRYFDDKPYHSDKFDVTELSRFQFNTTNENVSRIAVLNLDTQTWKFMKYFFSVSNVMTDGFLQKLATEPIWTNSRISCHAGSITLRGKTITVSHGLVSPVPQRKETLRKYLESGSSSSLLLGSKLHFTFPGL